MMKGSGDLIERYVYRVGRHLAADRREDVTRELLSLINDRVDDEHASGESREDAALRVLRDMGPPSAVAASYGYAPNLLIGVRSLPAFSNILKKLPSVLALVYGVLFALSCATTGAPTVAMLGRFFVSYLHAVLLNFGGLVITFIVLERFHKRSAQRAFDPAKLPPVPQERDGQKIQPTWVTAKIYALAALITLLNFRPDWFAPVWTILGRGRAHPIPMWALGIHIPVALCSFWLFGHIVLKAELLREGQWTFATRWTQVGLHAVGVLVLASVLYMSRSGQVDQGFLASMGVSPSDPVVGAFSQLSRVMLFGIAWAAIIQAAHFGKGLWRMSHRG